MPIKRVSEKEIVVSAAAPVRHKPATPRRPPLLLRNRLLIWLTPIGKLAAIRVVLPRKIGCVPNRHCAHKPPLSNLVVLRSQKLGVRSQKQRSQNNPTRSGGLGYL